MQAAEGDAVLPVEIRAAQPLQQLVEAGADALVLGEGGVEEEQARLRGVVVHLPKTSSFTQVKSQARTVQLTEVAEPDG